MYLKIFIQQKYFEISDTTIHLFVKLIFVVEQTEFTMIFKWIFVYGDRKYCLLIVYGYF